MSAPIFFGDLFCDDPGGPFTLARSADDDIRCAETEAQ
jgi:hypothetical protein